MRLCTIECDFSKPLESSKIPQNKAFVNDMKEWAKTTKNLFVWDYVTNFRSFMLPHPNLNVLAPNLRFFAENSAAGVFEQGDAFCSAGDFVLLRNYVLSHLMWNPKADAEKLFDEFLFGYYGEEVGKLFKQYLKVINESATKSDVFIGCFNETPYDWLDAKTYNKAVELLDKASATAKKLESANPKKFANLQKKVKRERLSFDHFTIANYRKIKQNADIDGVTLNLPKDMEKACANLVDAWNELNVETWREFTTPKDFANYKKTLKQILKAQMILAVAEKKIKKSDDEFFALYSGDIKKYSWQNHVASLGDIYKDDAAQIGYSTKIPIADDKEKIQLRFEVSDFPKTSSEKVRVKLFVRARADAEIFGKNSEAFSFNLFKRNWRVITSKKIKLSEVAGKKYTEIKLCDIDIPKEDFPINMALRRVKTDNVKGVYIEKISAK